MFTGIKSIIKQKNKITIKVNKWPLTTAISRNANDMERFFFFKIRT